MTMCATRFGAGRLLRHIVKPGTPENRLFPSDPERPRFRFWLLLLPLMLLLSRSLFLQMPLQQLRSLIAFADAANPQPL